MIYGKSREHGEVVPLSDSSSVSTPVSPPVPKGIHRSAKSRTRCESENIDLALFSWRPLGGTGSDEEAFISTNGIGAREEYVERAGFVGHICPFGV